MCLPMRESRAGSAQPSGRESGARFLRIGGTALRQAAEIIARARASHQAVDLNGRLDDEMPHPRERCEPFLN